MVPGFLVRSRRVRFTLMTLALAVAAMAVMSSSKGPTALAPAVTVCENAGMTSVDMAALAASHFAASPAHGARPYVQSSAGAVPADTFIVRSYQFDADHKRGTQNDLVTISAGQSVMFKWEDGIHTTTSGSPGDFDSGSVWDYPVDGAHTEVVVTFPNPGDFPFQCLYHGQDFNMTGEILVVPGTTPTTKSTWGTVKARYR